ERPYAVHLGHPDVEHHNMEMLVLYLLQGLGRALRRLHGKRRAERVRDRLAGAIFVVDNEHSRSLFGTVFPKGWVGHLQAGSTPFRQGWNMMCVCRLGEPLSNFLA